MLMLFVFVDAQTPTPTVSSHLYPISWRWISGSSSTGQNGVCGIAGEFGSSFTPGARFVAAMTAYASHSHTLYLFGGIGVSVTSNTGQLGDLWGYRQSEWSGMGEWAWLGGKSGATTYLGQYSGDSPFPCARHGPVAWNDPDFANSVFVFAGYKTANYNDLWVFNVTSLKWTWIKGSSDTGSAGVYGSKGVPMPENEPPAMHSTSMINTGQLFGGSGYVSDMWRYNSSTNQWTWLNGPSQRNMVSVAGDPGQYSDSFYPGSRYANVVAGTVDQRVYIFGGYGYSSSASSASYLADLWSYDIRTNQWAFIGGESSAVGTSALASYGSIGHFATGNRPGSRGFTGGWLDPNSQLITVFGGKGYGETTELLATLGQLNDFWCFNASNELWSWAGGDSLVEQDGVYADDSWFSQSNKPGKRCIHSTGVDLGLMFLFGGGGDPLSGGGAHHNDLWATRGPTVVVGVSPTVTPTPTPTPELHPIEWRWLSGSSTTGQQGVCGSAGEFSSSYTPGARWGAAVASYQGRLFFFGGSGHTTTDAAGVLNDVWSFYQPCWSCKGEWSWLGGFNDTAVNNGQYDGSTPYPGGRYSSAAWIAAPNLLMLHGGTGLDSVASVNGRLSDLWSFNIDTYEWKWLKGSSLANQHAVYGSMGIPSAGNWPGAVQGHVLLTSDSNTALTFGGVGYDSSQSCYLSDVWMYTNSTNDWTWISGPGNGNRLSSGGSSGAYSTSYYPGGRHGSVVMDTGSLIYVFGGYGYCSVTKPSVATVADTWAYDVVQSKWAYIVGLSNNLGRYATGSYGMLGIFDPTSHPGSRYAGVAYSDPNSDLIMLFGGDGFDEDVTLGFLNDFWTFNITKTQWAWSSGDSMIGQGGDYSDSSWFSSLNKPCARDYVSGYVIHSLGVFYLFGGNSGSRHNDLWATKGPTVVVGVSPTIMSYMLISLLLF